MFITEQVFLIAQDLREVSFWLFRRGSNSLHERTLARVAGVAFNSLLGGIHAEAGLLHGLELHP